MEDNEVEKLIKEYENYAKENGFNLNPDKKIVEAIVKSLLDREKKIRSKILSLQKNYRKFGGR